MNDADIRSPAIVTLFGGGGDLAWRKLVPSLFDLYIHQRLPARFTLLAVDHSDLSDAQLRDRYHDGIKRFAHTRDQLDDHWTDFARCISALRGDFTRDDLYVRIGQTIGGFLQQWHTPPHCIYYLATPPQMFEVIASGLARARLNADPQRSRIVIEKPFGHDLESAQNLSRQLSDCFDESQIFRIDHYLGKETVQNILVFRFANAFYEPLWNRNYIESVTMTVAEAVGVEHRAKYYEHAGALRDMVQNHLLQLLCLIAMEPMASFDADDIRNRKLDVLRAVRPIPADNINQFAVRGQYGPGRSGDEQVPGYQQEADVAHDSPTETYAALVLFLDNNRWQNVPFFLRTGKRLPHKVSEITLQFRDVPHQPFPAAATPQWNASQLRLRIQPNEGMSLNFQVKQPGPDLQLTPIQMDFSYSDAFRTPPPSAYEALLDDILAGDATLFLRVDEVEQAWRVVTPILNHWQTHHPTDFPNYPAGTWGPPAADHLATRYEHTWPE